MASTESMTSPSPFPVHRKPRVFAFVPTGFPRAFVCEMEYHYGAEGEPPHCEFQGMSIAGESVVEWMNENLLLDESALEEESLGRVPPHITGDFN